MKKQCPTCPDSYLSLRDWHAIHNAMPPGPDTFYVVGKVEVPTLGYSVALAAANPQGINQKILILDLTVAKPSGPAGQAVETLEVRWDYKGPYTGAYDEVHVRCGDEIVLKLDVEIVH